MAVSSACHDCEADALLPRSPSTIHKQGLHLSCGYEAAIDEGNVCERFQASGTAEEKRAAYELAAKMGDVVTGQQ